MATMLPSLLHLPTFPDHVAILFLNLLDYLIVPITHIHDLLCPDDGSIGDLDLISEHIQRISRHLLDNRNGLFR